MVLADATRARRVLLNLVTNACKHLASKVCQASLSSDFDESGNDNTKDGQGQILIRARLVSAEDDSAVGVIDDTYDNTVTQQ
jgi:signal transduction histidine kinase